MSWRVGGQNMLRCASDAAIGDGDRLRFASFPLVPYSNRIGHATFAWNGRQIILAPNFAPEPHAIHGTGWQDAWEAERVWPDKIILRLSHKSDNRWPWAFDAEQVITVSPDGLRLELSAHNRSEEAAPLGMGHHPHFDSAGASLAFEASRVWMSGDDNLPSYVVAPSGRLAFDRMGPVEGRNIDNCYADWTGRARIKWAERENAMEIVSSMRAAVIYIPSGGDAFCFEPVPHINNALNMAGQEPAMPVIAPGEAYRSTIEFKAVAA